MANLSLEAGYPLILSKSLDYPQLIKGGSLPSTAMLEKNNAHIDIWIFGIFFVDIQKGSLHYHGGEQCEAIVVLRDFPSTVQRLGWYVTRADDGRQSES